MNHLSHSERYTELSAALESTTEINRRPIQTLLLFYFGYTPEYLVKELHITMTDFRKWLQSYEVSGLTAFAPQETIVPDSYTEALNEALAGPPPQTFSEFEFWTAETLAKYLTWRTGVKLTVKELNKLLTDVGYRTRRFNRIEI